MSERWRVGRKVPLNIYEGNRPVCQCHTADDAKRIVAAMNFVANIKAGVPVQVGKFPPPLDCRGVDPASRTGKISTRKP